MVMPLQFPLHPDVAVPALPIVLPALVPFPLPVKVQFDTLNGLAALPRVPATQLTKENCSTLLLWNVLFCKKLFSPLRFWMKTPFSSDSLPAFFTVELRILRSMTFS